MIESQEQFFQVLDQAIPLRKNFDGLHCRIDALIEDNFRSIAKEKDLISVKSTRHGRTAKVVYFPGQSTLKKIEEISEQVGDNYLMAEKLLDRKSKVIDQLNPLIDEINEYTQNNIHVLDGLETKGQLEFFGTYV